MIRPDSCQEAALGRVTARFPRGARAAFRVRVGVSEVLTPYVRLGEWVPLTGALAVAVLLLLALKERGRPDA